MLALWKPTSRGMQLTLVSSGKTVRDNCIGDKVAYDKAYCKAKDKLREEHYKEWSKPDAYPKPGLTE